jgi:KDO transferase-3
MISPPIPPIFGDIPATTFTHLSHLERRQGMMKRLIQKYVLKSRRLLWPRPLKHMVYCSRHFRLRCVPGSDGEREILWRGSVVGRLQSLNALRGRYSGDCFVVGAGPSLAEIHLRRIAAWPMIGCNGTIVKFLEDGIRPSFYSITDPDFFEHRFHLVRAALESGATCFFTYIGLSRICERDPELLRDVPLGLGDIVNRRYFVPRVAATECDAMVGRDPDLVLHPTVRGQEGLVGFSRNMAKGMFCGKSVGYRGIQIAYHLGFRRVFLLGMDMGVQGNNVRFYETKEQARPSLLEEHYDAYIRPCFEIVKSLCDSGELEVYNCSLGSRLPDHLVPKIPFDDALARCRQARAA